MLSYDAWLPCSTPPIRSAIGRTLLTAAILASLHGCGDVGFRPLYGPTATGVRLEEKLASVEIPTIPSRVGQRIRNGLIFHTTGGGEPAPPVYRLEITIRESLSSTLVKSTGEALSQIYNLDATFKLITLKDRKVVLQGTSTGRAAFERFPSIYSNVRAREDAENRVASTVSDELKGRIAAFLSNSKV